jgi:hypothetical protein
MGTKNKKDVVFFSCAELNDKQSNVLAITPQVNDILLVQLVADFEKAHDYTPAGAYGGIIPQWFDYGSLEGYFLAEHKLDSFWAALGGEYVLGCECGEVGCWPLMCRITVVGDDIVWDQFKQPHRQDWDYSQFGPFVFESTQYKSALTELATQVSQFTRRQRG